MFNTECVRAQMLSDVFIILEHIQPRILGSSENVNYSAEVSVSVSDVRTQS